MIDSNISLDGRAHLDFLSRQRAFGEGGSDVARQSRNKVTTLAL